MARIKCPAWGCGSTDVQLIGGKSKTTLNLNPLKPFTLVNHKPTGKQKFMCTKCGKVWEQKKNRPVLEYRTASHRLSLTRFMERYNHLRQVNYIISTAFWQGAHFLYPKIERK